ncbi:uncharacterized protein LOC130649776 [Hydractinia symbiolongicarpus]|uniref:uncharacterized protein LOC130649776 n=1 Tax=Hydractinia symbiolongicarpus TaxID=13093 RepID=UPI00254D368C|nr:uncharacterized protein LOC130649776 [Hydractinia symbiolongicarpus]
MRILINIVCASRKLFTLKINSYIITLFLRRTVEFECKMECKVCSRICHEPIILNCTHEYCQDCVDGILQVNVDANGKLKCPLGCKQKTAVKQKGTGDMKREDEEYTFNELVEIIKKGDHKKFQSILIDNPGIAKMMDPGGCETLLVVAARLNKPSIVKHLIDAGSNVYATNLDNTNGYHFSARYGYYEVLKSLMEHNVAIINQENYRGYSPLHEACYGGSVKCVKLLLSVPHIDANVEDDDYSTPLHCATQKGHIACVRLLLSSRLVDVNKKNSHCRTAYSYAAGDVKRLFEKHFKTI